MVHRVPIEADTLLISPFVIILTVISIYWMTNKKFYIAFLIVTIIVLGNIYYLLSTEYKTSQVNGKIGTISKKIEASDNVIKVAGDKPYNIVGKGELSDFKSFTMPYEYLLWWKGSPPSAEEVDLKIIIWEKENEIIVQPLE